jgi:hypothetical protein
MDLRHIYKPFNTWATQEGIQNSSIDIYATFSKQHATFASKHLLCEVDQRKQQQGEST